MLPLIIISIVAAVFAILAYQYIIQKYYWGPSGKPPKQKKKGADERL